MSPMNRMRPVGVWPALAPASWLLVAFAGVAVLLFGGHFQSLVTLPVVDGLQVLSVLILGGWLLIVVLRPAARPTTPLMIPVAAASAAYALSGLLSQRPRLSLESTIGGIGFAIAFLFLSRLLAEPWIRRRAAALFVSIMAAIAVGYIVQVVINWIDWWRLVGRLAIPPLRPSWAGLMFGSPNVVGTFLILGAPLAVALLRSSTTRRAPVLLLAGVSAAALLLTGSRGAYLGAGLGLVVAGTLSVTPDQVRTLWRTLVGYARRRSWVIGPSLVVVTGVALLLPSVIYRFGTGGQDVRLDLWRSALTIFSEHPLTGGGPGTWVQLKVAANPVGVPNNIFNNAHNMYLQAAAELGVVGLVVIAALVLTFGARLLLARRTGDPALRRESLAVLAGVAAFSVQLLVENMIRLPAVCLLLVCVLAWVDAGIPAGPASRPRLSLIGTRLRLARLLPLAGLIAVAITVPTLIRIDVASVDATAGNLAVSLDDLPQALEFYDRAAATDPEFTLYDLDRASVLARVGRTPEARAILASVVEVDPLAANRIGLAALDLQLGDTATALEQARLALAGGVGEPTIALNAGLIGEAAHDRAFWLECYAKAIAWSPSLARSDFWLTPDRAASKDRIVADARALSTPIDAALISAYAGATDVARVELGAMAPSASRDIYIAVTDWLSGDLARAQDRLRARLDRDPLDWLAAAWLSRISRLSGDYATGFRYARWAEAVQADTAPSVLLEEGIIEQGTMAARGAGMPRGYPSSVYLRENPPFLVMPQLVLVGQT
jgi:O-antigen ligase/tetratricopeptide (TPR) repeat protein